MKILIAEDERDLNNILKKVLKKNGYTVDQAYDGKEALAFTDVTDYDGIVLDIMMPELDGYGFLKKIRNDGNDTPVLFLTAKDSVPDKVKGLDLGGDDYLTKPFDFDELLARIRAMIRRRHHVPTSRLQIGDLILDTAKKKVTRAGEAVDLTAKEYEILEYLMMNEDHVLSREKILDHVWGFDYDGESNTVDVMIKNIRKKIRRDGADPIIFTKRGQGYVAREE